MKKLVAGPVIAVLSVGAYAVAQTSRPVTQQEVQLAGGVITVDAESRSLMGNGAAFSGGVVITVNGVRVTADRAVLEASDVGDVVEVGDVNKPKPAAGPKPAADIRLEGNVRLSFLKQP